MGIVPTNNTERCLLGEINTFGNGTENIFEY